MEVVMSCYPFDVAMRKAVDALHEATAAAKMLRIHIEDREMLRCALKETRLALDLLAARAERYVVIQAEIDRRNGS
jgi:hypothetical protein